MAFSNTSVPFPMPLKNDDKDDKNDDESPPFRSKNRYDLNSRIMLTAIISLSAVVLLVIALHVYARYSLRRQARRRRAAFHRITLSAARARAASGVDPTPTPKAAGLDAFAIASLPTVPAFMPSGGGSEECAVCLGALAEGEPARILPGCGHAFHVECIDAWLSSQASCPVCRAAVEPPGIRPEPREPPSAPPLGSLIPASSSSPSSASCMELGTTSTSSSEHACCGGKELSSSSRFSSFRKMLGRERSSSRRVQSSSGQDQEIVEDLERQ